MFCPIPPRFLLCFAILTCAAPVLAAGEENRERVIILGFDGVDPRLAAEMMDNGELPNLHRLREEGSFQPLASSNPPQSPTAWSSFNTCMTPLNHGIYDFLRRSPQNYIPGVGFGSVQRAELADDGSLARAPRYVSNRSGENFWKIASDQGYRVKALVVPFAYPADDLSEECVMHCGLDVPDIRGTQSTYFAFSDTWTEEQSVAGGMRLPLVFTDNTAIVEVPGIAVPGTRDFVQVPLRVEADREARQVTLSIGDQAASLGEGEWSGWLEWEFPVSPHYTVEAISRFHVMDAADEVRLYMTALQFHPRAPMIPFSSPPAFSAELAERYGLYKTIGWVHDTKALQLGDMSEEMFLEDAARTMAWREQLCLDEIDRGGFDLLVAAWTATDRVSHMFWAYRDPEHPLYTEEMAAKYGRVVEDTYIKMDSIIGNVMTRLRENDLLLIMSDHGFHSFRTEFSVNTWLIRNGYLTVTGQEDAETAHTEARYFRDMQTGQPAYDWSRSRAYSLGLGMIFLNQQGREGQGIVSREDSPALIEEIRAKLLEVTDPETGGKVFENVYAFVDPQGQATADAPDIQLGYADGYQTAKASAAGAAPREIFAPNLDKWSGEHAASDVASTPGILFSNRPLIEEASLLDLGVTAFHYLNARVPEHFEGRNLLP